MTMFKVNGESYKTNDKGNYFYKLVGEKWERIKKTEWDQAYDAYIDRAVEDAVDGSVDPDPEQVEKELREAEEEAKKEFGENSEDWWDTEAETEQRKAKQEEEDRQTEEAFNKEKKAKKPRKSKDIAFTFAADDTKQVTLTKKQVEFIGLLPGTSFWEDGLDSTLWCDCLADDIGWNPMSVGAMISTLREKHLLTVDKDMSRKGKPKYMQFTELGKVVLKEMGL